MIALTLAAAIQAEPPCLKDGDRVEGEFRYVETRHPNGTRLRHPFVVTERPFCFAPVIWPEAPTVHGRWIQIHWSDEQARDPTPGDAVAVIVDDCNEPGTAWHTGDVFCDARLVSREPM